MPFAEAQLFKLRKDKLGYGRLCLAMWPLRSALASWRRANPEANWRDCLQEVISETETKKVPLQIRKSVQDVIERLRLISSGHAECPVPKTVDELLVWWATEPPN